MIEISQEILDTLAKEAQKEGKPFYLYRHRSGCEAHYDMSFHFWEGWLVKALPNGEIITYQESSEGAAAGQPT